MHVTLVILHVLGATVWTGGHLVLAIGFLPAALRAKSPQLIHDFESRYERIGLPALAIQAITGIILAMPYLPDPEAGTTMSGHIGGLLGTKLALLLLTIGLAVHARLRIIPKLSAETLPILAAHIVAVTVISVLFVIVGVAISAG